MTFAEIMTALETLAAKSTGRTGSVTQGPQPVIKVEDLKKIQKKIRKDHQLALDLYQTGNPDAQYLAGLIADEKKMTKQELQYWVEHASCPLLNEYTVAWIAAESPHGWQLALEWIDSKNENIQSSGWSALASIVGIKDDVSLDIPVLRSLMQRVALDIPAAGNRVRYTMNTFLIAAGGYVKELTDEAIQIAENIGTVSVDMGGTACKVPYAPDYIKKMIGRGVRKKNDGPLLKKIPAVRRDGFSITCSNARN